MTSMDAEAVAAGQAVYTPRVLSLYDLGVLGFSCRCIWRCPASRMLAQYDALVGARHLDVGVGTGFFLDRCRFPVEQPRIELVDLNENSLRHTAVRIARHSPDYYVRNVLEPLELDSEPVDSAALNFLLHCVPGAMSEKAIAFDHVAEHVRPGGVLFGSTILSTLDGGREPPRAARLLMQFYQSKGIFWNAEDDYDSLDAALGQRFDDVEIEVVGAVALFHGRVKGGCKQKGRVEARCR